ALCPGVSGAPTSQQVAEGETRGDLRSAWSPAPGARARWTATTRLHAFDRGANSPRPAGSCLPRRLLLACRLDLREQLPPRILGYPPPTAQVGHRRRAGGDSSLLFFVRRYIFLEY